MTFLELVQTTWLLAGLTGKGPTGVAKQVNLQGRMVQWVKDAYRYVQTQHSDWYFHWRTSPLTHMVDDGTGTMVPAPITLTAGQAAYTPEDFSVSDFRMVDHAWLANPYTLGETPAWRKLKATHDLRDSSGRHRASGSHMPNTLFVLPMGREAPNLIFEFDQLPDQAYPFKFSYYRTIHELVEALDEPLIPAEHQMTIVYKALEYYSFYDEDSSINALAAREYSTALHRLERAQQKPLQFATSEFLVP